MTVEGTTETIVEVGRWRKLEQKGWACCSTLSAATMARTGTQLRPPTAAVTRNRAKR